MVSAASVASGIAQRYGVWDKERFWTEQDWRKHLLKTRSKSRWSVLPQKVINSPAYMNLSFPAREALTQCYNIAGREKVEVLGDKRKRKRSEYRFLPFCLPLNLLRAVGFGCDRTAIKALKELLSHGFIEITERRTGRATIYSMSDDYLNFKPLSK